MTTATRTKGKQRLKSITIQPASPPTDRLKMPYPYHITKTGLVGRQDFWKGHPYRLLGFSKKPVAGDIDLDFEDFWFAPEACIDLFPVFANSEDVWATYTTPITSYHRNYEQ